MIAALITGYDSSCTAAGAVSLIAAGASTISIIEASDNSGQIEGYCFLPYEEKDLGTWPEDHVGAGRTSQTGVKT